MNTEKETLSMRITVRMSVTEYSALQAEARRTLSDHSVVLRRLIHEKLMGTKDFDAYVDSSFPSK